MIPTLEITMGDINGIGPEILAKALAKAETWARCCPIVVGSAKVLDEVRTIVRGCPQPRVIHNAQDVSLNGDWVPVIDGGVEPPPRRPGELDAAAGACAVEWVKLAVGLAIEKAVDGIVTCPINKAGIHAAGYPYAGHTDLIAEMTGARTWWMGLFTGAMRVVHVSAHLSMTEAIKMVRADRIAAAIRVGHETLVRLGLPWQRIAVAGLNPHAGESGAFGMEEIEEIVPAVRVCQTEGIDCSGPYAPDVVFRRMQEGEFDLVVAMYHDQGHVPLKLVAMDAGVNITLGIPIVRTSAGHGTAYELAGTGTARDNSLCCAIALAAQLAAGK